MPADAVNYNMLAKELNDVLSCGRIDKIVMSDKSTLMLVVRSRGENRNLIITAATSPRCFLSSNKITATDVPLSFCTHLRRHILGGVIDSVEALPFERILFFRITARDELGEILKRVMIVEIMGKYSNVVLTDGDLKISEALKHVDIGEQRPILPGIKYAVPDDITRFDPTNETATRNIRENVSPADLPSVMVKRLRGIAAKTAMEIIAVSDKENVGLAAATKILLDRPLSPVVYYDGGKPTDFSFCDYSVIPGERKDFDSLSAAMDVYYGAVAVTDEKNIAENSLRRALNAALDRQKKKLAMFIGEEEAARDYEKEKIVGELITANIYRIKPGDTAVVADNWYSGEQMVIKLTENSPQEDAQKHFKRYQKKKRTIAVVTEQIEECKAAIDYLESVETSLSLTVTAADVAEIRAELEESGIIGRQNSRKKAAVSEPRKYVIDGFEVLVGKSNIQNDKITKEARGEDLWLHTQGFHGSHVVVKAREEVPYAVIVKAAEIAAFFSKARQSENVPVDYTKAKNVHKKKGAAPGKVDYFGAKTIFVKPTPPTEGV